MKMGLTILWYDCYHIYFLRHQYVSKHLKQLCLKISKGLTKWV